MARKKNKAKAEAKERRWARKIPKTGKKTPRKTTAKGVENTFKTKTIRKQIAGDDELSLKEKMTRRVRDRQRSKTKRKPSTKRKPTKRKNTTKTTNRKGRKAYVTLTSIRPDLVIGGNPFNPMNIRATFANEYNEIDYKAMRKEYSRLRAVAMKRLERLSESDFSKSDMYKVYKDKFKSLTEIDNAHLSSYLSELNRFLASNLSTVSGQRDLMDQRIETLREYGIDINRNNFWLVMDIMEYMREHYKDLIYDSDAQLTEAISLVNDMINDPDARFSDKSVSELGDEVFRRYASTRSEAYEVFN